MSIFGASIGVFMCFFRQTLLFVCLVVPFALLGRPVANNDAATLEGVNVIFNVLNNDTPDSFGTDFSSGDPNTSSPTTIENSITTTAEDFSADSTRFVTLSLAPDSSRVATTSYIARNLNTASSTSKEETLAITVNAGSDVPPTITPIVDQTIDEDTQTSILDFTIDDIETDPADLTVTGASDNQSLVPDANIILGGSGADRNVQITPLADAYGVANITITVNDGTENNSIQFELTVTAINDVPTITPISDQAINQDESTGILAFTITDVETPAASLTVTGTSDDLTLVPIANIDIQGAGENRTVQVTPASGQNGIANITIEVDDGDDNVQTTFRLAVNAAGNTPPTITTILGQTIDEDTSTGALSFTVDDAETAVGLLVVNGSSDNTSLIPNGNIVFGGGGASRTVTVTPLADQAGIANITLEVIDGSATAQTTFQVTVNQVNDLPTITTISNQTINEDNSTGALAFTVGDLETSVGGLVVTGSSDNTSLVPNANIVFAGSGANRTVTVTPLADQNGVATITLIVDDGTATAQTTFQVTVNAVNDLPTISAIANQTLNEDNSTGALAITVGDAETPLGSLVVTGSSDNTSLIPNANIVFGGSGANRTVNVNPLSNQSGVAIITLTVNDGTATAQTTFQVTVNAVNDLPTISAITNQTISENTSTGALAFTVGDVETPAGTLVVAGSSDNTSLIPNVNIVFAGSGANRTVDVTPLADQTGVATITLTVNDGTATAQTTFQVTVNGVNNLPTITAIANQTISEDNSTGALAFTVGDAETPVASLVVTGSSDNTSLIPNANIVFGGSGANRTVNVTPLSNQSGVAIITLTVNDGTATAQTTFQVTVNAVNDLPTITAIANQTISEDNSTGALAFTVGDAETPVASLVVTGSSDNTSLIPNANIVFGGSGANRTVNVTPLSNQSGVAIITLVVNDGTATAQTTFQVTVNAVNDLPTISAIANQTIDENTSTGVLAFTVGDVETPAGTLVVTGSSDNTSLIPNANIVLAGSGANRTVNVTPLANQSGVAVITLVVNDGTSTAQTTFQVTVNGVNDLPTITAIANQTISEDNSTGALAFTVGDAETPVGSLVVTGSSDNTSLIPNVNIVFGGSGANRTVNVTPLSNQSGVAIITLTVNDGTATAQTTFQVTVNAVNDLPTISAITNQTINENTSTGALAFTVGDAETPVGSLAVTGSSDNTSLIPNVNIVFGGSGANRTVNVTPLSNQSGVAVITLVVNDGTATAQTSFQVTVNAVNDLPTITAIANQTISEDNSTGALAFTVGDAETPVGSLVVTGSSDNTSLIPNANIVFGGSGANRTVNVNPLSNQSGVATITLVVNDGTATAQTTFQVTVNAVNDLPTISAITNQTIDENTSTGALAFTVGDVETPAGTLVVTGSSDNTSLIPNANIVVAGSGANRTVNVTPLANQSGVAIITLTVNDGTATAQTTFQVTVNGVNDLPTITAIANQTINEDNSTGALAFTVGDAETPVASLVVTGSSDNTSLIPNANIVLAGSGANRTVNVTPLANQSGVATITLTVNDGAATAQTTFQVTVNAVNDSPTITAISNQVINEDGQTGNLAFTVGDVETPAGSLAVTAGSSNITLVPLANVALGGSGANRTVNVVPVANLSGTTVITLTVSDGTNNTQSIFQVSVTAVNDVPTITSISDQTIDENTSTAALAFTVGDIETAPGTLSMSGTSGNPVLVPNGNIVFGGSGTNRTVTVTPAANQSGVAVITLTVSDGVATAQSIFQLTVNTVDNPPTITSIANQTINEDSQTGPLSFTVSDDQTPLAALILTPVSSNLGLVPNSNVVFGGGLGSLRNVNVIPVINQNGVTTITLTVSDGTQTAQTAFMVTVTALDDPPTISTIADQTINEDGQTGVLDFTVGDPDTDPATLILGATSDNTTLVPNINIVLGGSGTDRTVQVTPVANQSGEANITITVSDGTDTEQTTFKVTVNAVNDPPTITSVANQTIDEDSPGTGALAFTIGDVETPPGSLVVTRSSSNTTVVPLANVVLGGSGTNRTVTVTPAPDEFGTTTITLIVNDGTTTTQTQFDVIVSSLNDLPQITSIADQSIPEDEPSGTGPLAFDVSDIETPAGSLSLSGASSDPTLVPVSNIVFGGSGANRTVTVTSAANQSGTATITVTVSDGSGTTNTGFLLTVTAVNDAPTITAITDQTLDEDAGGTGPLNFTVGDVETAPGSLTVTRTSSNTTLVPLANVVLGGGGANRTVTVTPAANQTGTTTITLIVNDGTTTTQTDFDVTVNDVNDPPQITAIADQTIGEDAPSGTGPLAFTVADLETPVGSLTLSGASSNTALVPISNIVFGGSGANRTVTVTPAANQSGTSTITVTVSDGTGTADTDFLLTVTSVNDVPTIAAIGDQTINEDAAGGTGALAFSVDDVETAPGSLTVTRTTSNPTLVPLANVVLGGGGANRTVTVTPAANQNGTVTITLTVSDGTITAQTDFDVVVTAVNDDPTITAIADQVIDENTSTGPLSFTIGDVETPPGSLNITTGSTNTTLVPLANIVIGGSGASRNVNVTPTPGESGVVTISITVGDGTTTVTSDFDLTVNAVDNPPTITAIADQVVNEDNSTSALSFTIGDPDTPIGSLTLSGSSSNTTVVPNANIVFGGSGASRDVTVTPATNQSGVTTITVNVSDGANTTPETFVLTVNAVNDGPTISAIADQTTNEDTPTGDIVFTIGDAETAASGLTVTASSSNTTLVPDGNITLGGTGPSRTINIAPAGNESGVTTITVNVSDGSITTPRTFQVTVAPVNDPPTITAIANQSIVEDTPTGSLAFTIGDVETPVGSLTVTRSSSNTILVPIANVVLGGSGASRTVIVTPAANETGSTTITITVDDGTATTSTNFTVNVTPIDDPPTISTISNRTINEDTQTGDIAFTISDPETAAALLTVTGSSSNTTLVPNANIVLGGTGGTRTVNIIPAANESGTVDITLNVSDGLNSTPTTFQVTVTPVNDAPLINSHIPVTINEGETVTIALAQLTVTDPDNNYPADFSLFVTGGANYSIEGGFTIRPNVAFNGVLSVPIFVSDGALISPVYQYVITVNSTNDPPQITGQKAVTILEDQQYNIQYDDLTVVDPDNTTYPTGFTMEILPGTNYTSSGQTVTPAVNVNGTITVNVRVNDGQANSNTWPFVITLTPVNDPPTITNQSPLSTNEEVALTLVVGNFTISDPEPATYTLNVLPSVSPDYSVTGTNQITPSLNYNGILSVPVTVSDGTLTSATFNAQVTVNPVNDAPQIIRQLGSLATIEDIPITLQLSHLEVTDVDVDDIYPTGFTLIVEPGTNYTFTGTEVTPSADYVGPINVVVRVNDGVANSPQFEVLIDVTDDADAPVITGQKPLAFDEDTSREIVLDDLLWEDPDTPQPTVNVQPGTNYTLEGNIVVPLPNFHGTLTVPVRLNDGEANSNTFPLQVVINPINDAPNFNQPANVSIQEDAAQQSITITGITAGPLETETLSLTVISENTTLIPQPVITPNYNGTAPTATIVFKPVLNESGVATIRITLVDGTGVPVPKTFTVTVISVNDPPTLSPIAPVTVIEDAIDQIIPLAGLSPGGGQPEIGQILTIIPNNDNPNMFDEQPTASEIIGTTSSLRFKLKPNANGTVNITVRVEDSGTPSAFITRSFTLTVTPTNDPPEFTSTAPTTAEPGVLYTYNVEVTDVDGEAIVLTAANLPAWLSFVNGTNGKATLSGTPPAGPGGVVNVLLEAMDPTGPPIQQPISITVNSRPVLTSIEVETNEDTPHPFSAAQFSAGYFDADGNPLAEVEITEGPEHGTLTLNNTAVAVGAKIAVEDLANLVYTPDPNAIGQDTIRWKAADGFGLYSSADTYVAIEIKPVNDLPVATIVEVHDVPTENDTLKYELGREEAQFLTPLFEGIDPDGDNIVSASVVIDPLVYRPDNERLIFVPTANVSGQFNEDSGILQLSGTAPAAEYVQVIRSIQYNYVNARELILDTRRVYVTMTDAHQGRSPEDSRPVQLIYNFSDLDIPTAFTPNGDGPNETWQITSANGIFQYDDAEVKVYNKRGLLLFETRGFENQWNGVWNGEVLPSDTYFYTIELNFNRVRYKGTVTILR